MIIFKSQIPDWGSGKLNRGCQSIHPNRNDCFRRKLQSWLDLKKLLQKTTTHAIYKIHISSPTEGSIEKNAPDPAAQTCFHKPFAKRPRTVRGVCPAACI